MSQRTQPTTVLQFSMRSILAGVAVLSVGLAVLVPFVHAQPPAFRRNLVWGVFISIALAVIGSLFLCLRRWRIETRGGTLLLRPTRLNPWLDYLPCVIMVVIFAGILVGACVIFMPAMKEMSRLEQGLGWTAFGLATSLSVFAPPMLALVYAITLSWWQVTPMTLEIRENGIGIGGLRFFLWSAITGCQWTDGKHAAILTLWCHSRKNVAMMPLDAREPVQRLLEAKGIKP